MLTVICLKVYIVLQGAFIGEGLVNTYCGSDIPPTIISDGQNLIIHFSSAVDSIQKSGFNIICEGKLNLF